MYPIVRLAREVLRARRMPPLGVDGMHVSHHIVLPWDIDPWKELNNGRTLTLYDLGRIGLFTRSGAVKRMREHGWGAAIAGASVRYRKRLTMFQRFELRSRVIGWDARFLYVEQGAWSRGDCASHALLRVAILAGGRMKAATEVASELGLGASPELPDWVVAWGEADAARPWPPTMGA
ncbi:acyl-CoA thioesterase [Roseicyclus sp. F158]|uniref:Acyl-CoA thioesterase n=1 Tax=Tropicimonas omnivorans TaxID=3075590 RepID=A0ABU3DCA9_9RHOB|nr:acyl-CoA thioesterase [Roseicyclus sp. F158]MDT0681346.1 acyl-CoA thioesterase [Roseicyclus sp. F158]